MTRFARAKGSKASNERIPERATPWNQMKEEMQRKQQESSENKEREKLNKVRQANYDNFLKQQESEVKTEWAEFPEDKNSKPKQNSVKKTIKKEKKDRSADKMISKEQMLDMLKPDAEIDAKLEKITSQINKVLDKKETKSKKTESIDNTEIETVTKKKNKNKKNKSLPADIQNTFAVEDISVPPEESCNTPSKKIKKSKKGISPAEPKIDTSDKNLDAPAEVSAKIAPPEIVVSKKKKNKKTPLRINLEKPEEKEVVETKKTSEQQNNTETEEKKSGDEPEAQQLTKSMKKRLNKKKKKDWEAKNNEGGGENTAKTNTNKSPVKPEGNKKNNAQNRNNNKREPNNKRKFEDTDNKTQDHGTPNKFPRKEQKMKVAKVRDNKEHPRRKPDTGPEKMIFNGVEVDVVKFDGFPVKKEDADRLHDLRRQMISKGIPRSEVKRTLLLERRKAEKSLTREKKKVCFQCRKSGHMLSECPELNSGQVSFSGSGICFKCGSTEHTHFECKIVKNDAYKFASCFICREQGHIAKQCPDNPKGLYPDGGACKLCGDVTHLKKDCPQSMQEREENTMFLKTISDGNLESIDDDLAAKPKVTPAPAKNKVIKF